MPYRLGDSRFAEFVLFQLPDALWAFALMYVFLVIWKDAKNSMKFLWVLIGVLFIYGIEFSQYLGSGTFDILDVNINYRSNGLSLLCEYALVAFWRDRLN